MMGLLDLDKAFNNPMVMAGLGILANNNSQNFGQVVGNGMLQGYNNYQALQNAQQRQKVMQEEMAMRKAEAERHNQEFMLRKAEYERKIAEENARKADFQGLQQAIAGASTFRPYADPQKAVTTQIDPNQVNSYLAKLDPAGYAKNLMERQRQQELLGSIAPMIGGSGQDWEKVARTAAVGAVTGMDGASTLMQYANTIKPNLSDQIAAQKMYDETGNWPAGYTPPQSQPPYRVQLAPGTSPEEAAKIQAVAAADFAANGVSLPLPPKVQRELDAKAADPSIQLERQQKELDIENAKIKAAREAEDATKQTPENAGKIAMQQQAITDIQEARKIVFGKNGQINRGALFQSELPGGGVSEDSRMLASKIENAIAAKLRLETGAAAPVEEVRNIAKRFMPSIFDSKKSAADKLDRLEAFFNSSLGQTKGVPKSSMGAGGWSVKLKGQ